MNILYEKSTGKIVSVCNTSMQPTAIEAATASGELEITQGEGVLPATHYVLNGVLITIPDKPSEHHVFSYDTKAWVLNAAAQLQYVLQQRETLLTNSDWTQLPDVPLGTKDKWIPYRQALRDITEQSGYPLEVCWPNKPE